jgi:hypothetical protein
MARTDQPGQVFGAVDVADAPILCVLVRAIPQFPHVHVLVALEANHKQVSTQTQFSVKKTPPASRGRETNR